RALGEEHAVLVSSHALAEVEGLCDRVVILHRGRVLAADRPAGLAARLRQTSRIEVEAAAPGEALVAALAAVPGVRRVDLLAGANGHARCRVEAEPGEDVRARLAADVTGRGWGLLALAPLFGGPLAYGLAAVFVLLTGYFFYSDLVFFVLFGGANLPAGLWRFVFLDYRLVALLVLPLLSMRLLAEERKLGTLELLSTYPVRDREVLAGKFLAAFFVYLVLLV